MKTAIHHTNDHKRIRYLLYFLHSLLGVSASVGGLMLMLKPDGAMLQMKLDFLKKTPFATFFFPGLLLFTFIGLSSMLSFFGLVFKFNFKIGNTLNIYPDRHWAWAFSLYTGISTILWISIQLMITAYFWLQPIINLTGLSILICSLTPGVMKHYEINTR